MYARPALVSLALVCLMLSGCEDARPSHDGGDGQVPDGGADDGDAPDADTPDGDAPDADAPDGDAPDDCGGPGVRCGRFVFAVRGLRYETPTLSGETDTDGTFHYRAGETVRFSVGGVSLGDAAGAATISPFDLVGIEAPTKETALRAELHEPRDVTPFDEAANIACFLVALDADLAPANGVDVSAWHTILADEALSFSAPLYEFRDARLLRLARRHGVSRNVPIDLPLAHLYDALGVVVPAHVAVADFEERSFGGQRMSLYDARFTHDAEGRRTSVLYYDDRGTDALWDGERTTYDAAGRRTSFALVVSDGDGIATWRLTTWTYDARGNVATTEMRVDADLDGTFEPGMTTTFAYDARDNLVLETTVTPSGRSITTVRAYDADGNEITTAIDDDVDDRIDTTTRTFDAQGNELTGVRDGNTAGVRARAATVSTYDASGGLLTRRSESDEGADGTVELVDLYTYTRHPNGRPASTIEDLWIGDPNAWRRTEVHDERGRTTSRLEERVKRGGVYLQRVTTAITYAPNGDHVRSLREQINSGMRFWSEVTRTYAYGAAGFLESRTSVIDGDDSVDRHTTWSTWTYTPRASGVRALLLAYVPTPGP